MRRRHDVAACGVDLGVDGERRAVHGSVPDDDVTRVVHAQQFRHRDLREGHAEGVDPEEIRVPRIPRRDVARHALVEAEPAEETEPRGESLLAVLALDLDVLVAPLARRRQQFTHVAPLFCSDRTARRTDPHTVSAIATPR